MIIWKWNLKLTSPCPKNLHHFTMPRKTPLVTVSAVVTPVMYEEIERLARSQRVTKSQMVRQLLEERLVQKANQRQEEAYDRLERRLKKMEDRIANLSVASTKQSAQAVALSFAILKHSSEQSEKELNKLWDNSLKYAAEQVSRKIQPVKGEKGDKDE